MMTMLALVLAMAGFTLMALSQAKHHRDLLGRMPSRTEERALRTGGWLLLGSSLAASIAAYGPSIGFALWPGVLTIAALTVTFLMTYQHLWRRA